MDRIIAESGVAKATLYAQFGCEDALVVACLRQWDTYGRQALKEAAEAAGPDPRDQLTGLFDAVCTVTVKDGFRGCAFARTAERDGGEGGDPGIGRARLPGAELTHDGRGTGPGRSQGGQALRLGVTRR